MRDRVVAAWTRGPGWRWPTLLAAVGILAVVTLDVDFVDRPGVPACDAKLARETVGGYFQSRAADTADLTGFREITTQRAEGRAVARNCAVDVRLDGDRRAARFQVFRGDDGMPAIHVSDPWKKVSAGRVPFARRQIRDAAA